MNINDFDFELCLYYQTNLITEEQGYGLAIQMYQDGEPYAMITVNLPNREGVCEEIGIKNAAYVDSNNCPWTVEMLKESGKAFVIGWRGSGFCKYPLMMFDEEWLKSISKDGAYEMYEKQYSAVNR